MLEVSESFARDMVKLGFISHDEQRTLWELAKRCVVIVGVPMGMGLAKLGAGAGTVTVPGFGTISGGLAGFLAGLATGTAACTMLNMSAQQQLKQLARTAY